MRIGGVEIPGRCVLAPMAGVADAAFRELCRDCGAALTVSEMISAKALVYQDAKTKELLTPGRGEKPFSVQLFGSEPEIMAEAAKKALALSGADIIDLNMGCPTGKIVRNNEGCSLMRDVPLAARIVEAVAHAVPVPVTVKFRKGWDKGSVNAVDFAAAMEAAGAAAVAVHGRTRAQLYSGAADWDIIAEVKRRVSIPVMANGDVFEAEDALRILARTGADLVMIGRGSMGDPFLFERASAAIEGRPIPPKPSLNRRCDAAMRQFERAAELKCEKIACLEARKHYAWYLRGVAYAGYYKEKIAKATTLSELRDITDGIKRELR